MKTVDEQENRWRHEVRGANFFWALAWLVLGGVAALWWVPKAFGASNPITPEQIGNELHAAYKLNASEAQYAYMGNQAALSHGGKSLEDVLKMCAGLALAKSQYSPEDIRAAFTLAKSLKANDEKVFTASVTGNYVYAAMRIHADILDCAMPSRGRQK